MREKEKDICICLALDRAIKKIYRVIINNLGPDKDMEGKDLVVYN